MSTGTGERNGKEMAPDLAHARRTANVAHGVVIKLKEMGLPENLDQELGSLSTDLGDLKSAEKTLGDSLEVFLMAPHDWEAVGDHLVDLKSSLDHMEWHLKSVRRPLSRIARFAYRKALEPQASNDGSASGP